MELDPRPNTGGRDKPQKSTLRYTLEGKECTDGREIGCGKLVKGEGPKYR